MIDYIVLLIFIVSIYYTFKYKFIQVKCFKKTKEVLVKKRSKTAYQTFVVGLASCVGVGNIIGVSTALIVGGVGSIFWMIVFAFFSSIFSIMENTLAVRYRVYIGSEYRGGSSYYIKNGLKMNRLSIFIAIFLVLSNTVFFQPLQVNSLKEAVNIGFNIPYHYIFFSLSFFAIFFIFTGTKKIVSFSEKIVPIMSIGFMMVSLYTIIINIEKVPYVFLKIFNNAFDFKCITGGGLYIGIKRSLFSHEAGLGTMPTISAMSNVDKAVNQGFVQAFGVFFDTIIMCTLTGLMILVLDLDLERFSGYDLIINVYEKIFNNKYVGKYIAIIFMFSFAIATIVSQYYLGESNLIFLSNQKENNKFKLVYKILYIIGIFIGVYLPLSSIWNIIDYGMIIIGVINIYSLIKLQEDFKFELNKK